MKVKVGDQIDQLLDLDNLGIGGVVIPGKIKSYNHDAEDYEGACSVTKIATEKFLTKLSDEVKRLKSEDTSSMSSVIEVLEQQVLENTDGIRIASALLASLIMHHKERRGFPGIAIFGI
jgi:hypothetical protein